MVQFVSMQCNMFYYMLDFTANEAAIKGALNKYYGDGVMTTLGVPVQAPLEIPRLICFSKNGHSQVLVAGNCTQLAVGFDAAYQGDADKCYGYLMERADVIRTCLRDMEIAVSFVGVTAQVKKEAVAPEQELMDKFFHFKTSKPVFDVLGKVTFVEDEAYYVNITLHNVREKMISEDIALTLDINDRYRLNFHGDRAPVSALDALEIIIDKHKAFFADKVEKLLQEGIYDD